MSKSKRCRGCEHIHAPGTECQRRILSEAANWAPKCGCREGA